MLHILQLNLFTQYIHIFLRDNQIQFIPSELVLLDSLNTILLEGNLTLKSPPANDIPTDVQGLRAYLLHRHNRSDAFIACVRMLLYQID